MKKLEILNRMATCKALAIVRAKDVDEADEIAQGCLEGGIDVMEMSYTLNNAGELIEGLKGKYQDRLICGAGTVLDAETARHAILHGADFIIAPNYDEGVAKMCNRYQIPYAPGCTSMSEAVQALENGASYIKAFPISDFYGSKLVKVFKTPIPYMPIMASGGVTLDNLQTWLDLGVDCVGFGTLLTKGGKDVIAKNARAIRKIIDGE